MTKCMCHLPSQIAMFKEKWGHEEKMVEYLKKEVFERNVEWT